VYDLLLCYGVGIAKTGCLVDYLVPLHVKMCHMWQDTGMPSRNIHLTKELDQFVDDQVGSGQYSNASEVVRAGLSALQDKRQMQDAKLEALRTAVLHGINSGVAEGDVIGDLRRHIHDRAARVQQKTA
jgi:antitoxin ParD1/3/4